MTTNVSYPELSSEELLHIIGRATRLTRNAAESLDEAAILLTKIEDMSRECVLSASASNLVYNLHEQLDSFLEALEEADDEETALIPLQQALKSPARPLSQEDFKFDTTSTASAPAIVPAPAPAPQESPVLPDVDAAVEAVLKNMQNKIIGLLVQSA